MRKRWIAFIACLLAALMLTGCAAEDVRDLLGGGRSDVEHVAFSEMVYARPDMSEMDTLMEELQELLDGGARYKEVEAKLDECFAWYYSFYTQYTLCEVHSYLDMTDEYYAEEFEWISDAFAVVQQTYDKLYYACAGSPLGEKLEKHYFWEGFCEEYSDPEDSVYSDEYVALLQEETALLARYHELVAAPTVEYQGEQWDLDELLAAVDDVEYNAVLKLYYDTYNQPLAEVYIELMRVRRAMAERLDYDSYEQMQYEFYFERDYTPEEAHEYLAQIREHIVPYYRRLMATDPYGAVWYDEVSEEQLFSILKCVAGEIGGDVEEAFDFMEQYELYDTSVSSKKANMSFETYFADYEEPFVFLGAGGDTEDVLAFAHEFGHFCDGYVNQGAMSETIDLAEVYSQAMELLALSRLSDAMSEEDVDNIAKIKTIDLVSNVYIQQAAFAEFEARAYALSDEELTVEKLNEIMYELSLEYGFGVKGYQWYFGRVWIDITHFFEAPFYVISYPVSNDLAMQIYALEREEAGKGMDRYLDVLRHDYNGLMELVADGGFTSPFAEGRMEEVAELLSDMYGAA